MPEYKTLNEAVRVVVYHAGVAIGGGLWAARSARVFGGRLIGRDWN